MRQYTSTRKGQANQTGLVNRSQLKHMRASQRTLVIMTSVLVITVITSFIAVAGYAGIGGNPYVPDLAHSKASVGANFQFGTFRLG